MNEQKGPFGDMVPLDTGVFVPRRLHDELFEHVTARVEKLKYDEPYKAKEMVDPSFYATQAPWIVGRCVSHWERHHDLPLHFLGCRYCSVRYYGRT